jgi:hypothetical protein
VKGGPDRRVALLRGAERHGNAELMKTSTPTVGAIEVCAGLADEAAGLLAWPSQAQHKKRTGGITACIPLAQDLL